MQQQVQTPIPPALEAAPPEGNPVPAAVAADGR
jgi:hypothetical protein